MDIKEYNITLTKEQILLYVGGLGDSVRGICAQIANSNNSVSILRQYMNKLIEIDKEVQRLDKEIDLQDKKEEPYTIEGEKR